jgi:hypothetical protein
MYLDKVIGKSHHPPITHNKLRSSTLYLINMYAYLYFIAVVLQSHSDVMQL